MHAYETITESTKDLVLRELIANQNNIIANQANLLNGMASIKASFETFLETNASKTPVAQLQAVAKASIFNIEDPWPKW